MPKPWRIAESLKMLRKQINDAFPGRDKASDGSIGDQAHSKRKSDHNPNAAGVVCAIDTDEDLAPNIHSVEKIVSAIRASKDPRVNYIIYEGRITRKGSTLQAWDKYTGPNPHNHHFHISVYQNPKLYDDPRPWSIGDGSAPATEFVPAQKVYTIRPGDSLGKIATAHNTTVGALVKLNNLKNPDRISIGQVLKIQ